VQLTEHIQGVAFMLFIPHIMIYENFRNTNNCKILPSVFLYIIYLLHVSVLSPSSGNLHQDFINKYSNKYYTINLYLSWRP